MGTSERKQREREEREQLFLDTAEQLIAEEGFLQLQMAKLAKACDYATGTLYQHFSSKEDLLMALMARQSALHLALFERIEQWQAPSRMRIFAICVAEQDFNRRQANYVKLSQYVMTEAVWENASEARRQQLLQCGQPICRIVSGIVQQAIDDGDLDPQGASTMELAYGTWALCQGSHTLEHTQGLLEAFSIPRSPMTMYRNMNRLLNGMQWQPLQDLSQPEQLTRLVLQIEQQLDIA
ncbi:helix-turn-helix domain-containing protein [Alkalimonas delamerensis]|uniref:Helix-turn-helix domain-containing protein n=1 Tax=Alkalimonas delamerensis TaxID=265981 RepID=A0ABT9GL52_9GAMM|nr:TetR/AcrR family transcriptional regulator [Alkalimonas delamerensis]MDP4527669.1 helix-turn-helix domain-containing protein [Alkalimonas delamerensis]